ncbi:hypothetical protein OG905_33330 [Streptomyces sp. NBC_00322]|uniref:SCO7613 C-terminal domain-containing membrane protein n=1 Tax=Streptomyces sp. NBC_00322 TaxID=2975712 RepID=UPI002E2C7C5F|nr:hypothetical protein [Streptomyces sp. NBC_00322]
MENVPPPAEELAILDRELVRLDARRAQLLARRAWLLTVVQPRVAPPPPAARPFAAPPPDAAPRSVQNLLLTLGGILLTIAAIAFTLVSWGHLGIGGRSAVLGAVTVAALAAPVALLRRTLASTAESLAGLGLVLMVLDAYALHRVALAETGGLAYAAVASAVLAALWAAYGLSLDRLRIPLPVAVLTAQLPLPLWSLTAGPGAPPMEWALLATASLDVAVALRTPARGCPVDQAGSGSGVMRLRIQDGGGRHGGAMPTDDNAGDGVAGRREPSMIHRTPPKPGLRPFAATGAAVTGGWALLIGCAQSVTADTPLDALAPAGLLLAAAGVALFAAWRSPSAAMPCSAVAGLATIAALGAVARAGVPEGWSVLGYLLCAVGLLVLVRTGSPRQLRQGLTAAAGAVHALAALLMLPLVALTLAGPLSTTDTIWSSVTGPTARGALGVPLPEPGLTASPIVLLIVAATLATASRWWPSPTATRTAAHGDAPDETTQHDRAGAPEAPTPAGHPAPAPGTPGTPPSAGPAEPPAGPPPTGAPWPAWGPPTGAPAASATRPDRRAAAGTGALALAWAGLFVVPPALDLGYIATLTLHVLLTAAALALAVRPASTARLAPAAVPLALACSLAGAGSVTVLSLATRPATFTVLGTLTAALAAAAFAARGPRAVQAVLAGTATGFATALLGAVAAAAELPPHRAALLILAVPAAVALLAAGPGRHPVALPMELTGAAAGLVAVVLAAGDGPTLALVLALGGVIAAGTAVRAERRPAAGYLAAALFVLATWVRLYASDVTTPEAYTLPVTLPALAVGALRRRRDPETSSWTAYGPGLAATLLPSLVAAWGDDHWLRPLLLGLAALALTLTGARLRLQALLVLGGTVLALDALHELAPYVVQVVGALPRWLPPALAGLLLLAVGATYEQRLRDARRLRDTLGRMR